MNDSELENKLKAAAVPERNAEYWDLFPQAVLSQLDRRARRRDRPAVSLRWLWALGLASACVLIAFILSPFNAERQPVFAALENSEVIRQTLGMFPNQVRAIVQDEEGTRLVLSEKPDVPDSPPLWIRICNGKECRIVITFSGQSFEVAKERVEVLADAQGQVMLVGDRLFWSEAEQSRSARHLRIQARSLEML
ncbi:MAG TPA: hypothetical protein VEH04_10135 [Verrucomicrobiae bacterium]|nr:hypothetical protein [Verrucomicrobiae bacterium]